MNHTLELLIDRLRWPAGMVRERAASQLGNLIAEGNHEAKDGVIAWIARQQLESLAAMGLLPFLRAARMKRERVFAIEELVSACEARSVLSDLYMNQIDPRYVSSIESCKHSGPPSDRWQSPATKDTDLVSSFQTSLRNRLETIEGVFLKSVARQFDFEVSELRRRYGDSPQHAHTAAGYRNHGYHPGWDYIAREICLSAYLRTLAWTASTRVLPFDAVSMEAATIGPVDLALWEVGTSVCPEWWPELQAPSDKSSIDAEIATVMRNVESCTEAWIANDYVVLAAGGCLHQTSLRQYDLSVRSFFQRPIGPNRPSTEELFTYLQQVRTTIRQDSSPLRFEGRIETEASIDILGDWLIIPSSGSAYPVTPHIWQPWRRMRGIQCPTNVLTRADITAVCREDHIEYESGGKPMAYWSDWTSGMSSLVVRDLLPATGWMLVIPRVIADNFAHETGTTLAWSWEIVNQFRNYSYEGFTALTQYNDYGANLVIRPW